MKHKLSGILNDKHRQVIHAVVEEFSVMPLSDQSVAMQLMPLTDVPAAILEHEIISAYGGKTNERVMNAPGKTIQGNSSESKIYKPGSYQESIPFFERDLLSLRKFGTLGERGVTGLTSGELDQVSRAADKLQMRLINRAHDLIWKALFNDTFTYQGVVKAFGRPAQNTITAATDWSVPAGDPFKDLVTLFGNNPVIRKYKAAITKMIINPKTASDIVLRALERGYITNANIGSGDINEVMKFAAPGLPLFEVVDDAIQEETIDSVTQETTLGDATYLVPDNKLLLVIDFNKRGLLFPKYGELQITENMNDPSATIERPAVGMYTFLDEIGLQQKKSPHVEVVAGFNGGPNHMRPFDTLIIEY
jgi:hypothetical protein